MTSLVCYKIIQPMKKSVHSTIFEMDLAHIIELDGGPKVPILVDEILRHSEQMVNCDGIFRKSCAVHTTTGFGL